MVLTVSCFTDVDEDVFPEIWNDVGSSVERNLFINESVARLTTRTTKKDVKTKRRGKKLIN